jgi:hypothetical protein
MTAPILNTHPVPFKLNGTGHARPKSIAACNAADAIDAVSRTLAKVLDVAPQYIGCARKLTSEQREAVRRGTRPVIART